MYLPQTCWLSQKLTHRHREDDTKWPQKNKDGRQELEIRLGNEHISFEVRLTRKALDRLFG